MDRKAIEKENFGGFNHEFKTPIKGYQDASHQMSTTANLNSHEPFSFDKMIQKQKMAIKYCSANLNELLGSDIKFKSPANIIKANTPVRHDWDGSAFFDIVQEYDSAAKFIANKLNLDMTIRKDSFNCMKMREDDLLKDYNHSLDYGHHSYRNEFHVEDTCTYRGNMCRPQSSHYYHGDINQSSDDYRKRKRKNNNQLKILKNEYSKGDCWNKEKISQVAQITGLSESQVYKWCLDQKKKVDENESGYKPDSAKMNLDFQVRAALLSIEEDEIDSELPCYRQTFNIAKRKPEREPFSYISKNTP